jgi:sucrose-6-phosphate hydrolase SacC (GH32 family)
MSRYTRPQLKWTLVLVALATRYVRVEAGDTPAGTLEDKTLVAWVSPGNLTQRGGSVLTLEKEGGVFDAIVFGEISPGRWMAGSDFHRRTRKEQSGYPSETVEPGTIVQVAIAYKGNQITLYRNGKECSSYTTEGVQRFGTDSLVVMGLRHLDAGAGSRFFTGSIEEARIYDIALDGKTVAALEPAKESSPEPYAWWTFEDGSTTDRQGRFPASTLVGEARVADGRLHLPGEGAYLVATRQTPIDGRSSSGRSGVDSSARALREKLLGDPHRPGYHFVVPEGRCMPFDPNGAIFWKGRYHLFYIFQDHRGHNWGHVSSTDLFHWRHHPTGLVSGMFSGNCFINKDGRPTMCYHQVGQGNALAVALDDELNEWKKLDSNPITPKTEPGDPHHGRYRSWDPFGWLEGDTYYAIFGGERPAVAKAPSLAGPWVYVGDLMARAVEGVSIREDVSCADFFKLGDRHMLLCISHRLGCRYYLGDWKDEAFHPTCHEQMSWVDNSFFAPESLLDDQGRRIMWAWIFDSPGFQTRMDFGWSGTMSLPRVLSLGEDGGLRVDLPEEIERLRSNGKTAEGITVPADSEDVLEGIGGDSIELAVEMESGDATRFGLKIGCSPDGEEQTLVFYDAQERALKVDTRRSSVAGGPKTVEAGPFELKEGEPLELRVFVDKSVVEVFANRRQAVMRRIYPSREDSVGVRLFSAGGPARVTKLQAWEMRPSNPY